MNERSVFLVALEKTDPAERAAYLDEACAGDDALRQQVERLLRAHTPDDSFLEKPAVALAPTSDYEPLTERPGTMIGPYKLLQQIGEGGMSVVYMAEQQEPIRRKVALKIIKPGMDSRQVIARFEAERQALAMMDHLNIAKVLDAGTTETGRPFFVMELVHGVPITKYCDDNKLTPRQRLELFVPICQAIQHAHQKGIIHRDIKPSNVLVTMYDDKAVPKVIDFGVAKAVEQRLTEKTLFTQFGSMVGTLEYMSPEQAEMNAFGVDTRSDVYSLGVLLYELLTGTTPLERKRLREAAYGEIVRLIKEEEAVKPSLRLSTSGASLASISQQRNTDPAKLTNLVRGELDWLVMKCLEKDRTRRYDTASGLARDVERYLKDEPVEACPPTLGYRLQKVIRKHKAALTIASGFAAMLLVAVVLTSWLAIRAEDAKGVAITEGNKKEEALQQKEEALQEKEEALRQKEKARQDEADQRKIVTIERDATKAANENLRSSQYLWDMQMLPIAWEAGHDVQKTTRLLNRHIPLPPPERTHDLRGFEWFYWDRLCHSERDSRKLQTSGGSVGLTGSASVFSEDCTQFARLHTPLVPKNASGSIRPDPKRASGDAFVKVWEVATGKELLSHSMTLAKGPPPGMEDQNSEAYGSRDRMGSSLQICDTGTRIASARVFKRIFNRREPNQKPDTAPEKWTHLQVVEVKTGKVLFDHTDWAGDIREWNLSPDGNCLAVVMGDTHCLKLWDLNSGNELFAVEAIWVRGREGGRGSGTTGSGTFSADSKRIFGIPANGLGIAKVWDANTGKELMSWESKLMGRMVYSPDGNWVAGILREFGGTSTLKVWNAVTGKEQHSFLLPKELQSTKDDLFFNARGNRLGCWTQSQNRGEVAVWDLVAGRQTCTFSPNSTPEPSPPKFSHDGRWLIDSFGTGWNAETGKVAFTLETGKTVTFTPDDRTVLSLGSNNTLKEWEIEPKASLIIPVGVGDRMSDRMSPSKLTLSPDAMRIAAVSPVGEEVNAPLAISVWDAVTGQRVAHLTSRSPGRNPEMVAMALSGDGRRIALARTFKALISTAHAPQAQGKGIFKLLQHK